MLAEDYLMYESFEVERSVCSYLHENKMDHKLCGRTRNGGPVLVYTTKLTEVDALFIKLAYPDVRLTKLMIGD